MPSSALAHTPQASTDQRRYYEENIEEYTQVYRNIAFVTDLTEQKRALALAGHDPALIHYPERIVLKSLWEQGCPWYLFMVL